MAGLAVLPRITDAPLDVHGSLFANPGSLLFPLLLSFVFPAVEEVVLRGFYLDALECILSAVPSGVHVSQSE